MNWSTALIIGNQLYNNYQTAAVRNSMNALYGELQNNSDRAERQRLLKQILFEFREQIEDFHGTLQGEELYSAVEGALVNLSLQGVTVKEFDELTDKEYAKQILAFAEKIKQDATTGFNGEEIAQMDRAVRNNIGIPLARSAAVIHELIAILPKKHTPYINLNLAVWAVLALISLPAQGGYNSGTALFMLLVFVGLFAYYLRKKFKLKAIYKKAAELASGIGLQLYGNPLKNDITPILNQVENQIRFLGLPTHNTADGYKTHLRQLEQ